MAILTLENSFHLCAPDLIGNNLYYLSSEVLDGAADPSSTWLLLFLGGFRGIGRF